MYKVTQDMDDGPEGHNRIQDHKTRGETTDMDPEQRTKDEIAKNVMNYLGDILFINSSMVIGNQPRGSKSPEAIMPSHKDDSTPGSSSSIIPERKPTSSMPPSQTSSDVHSQLCTEWQPSRLLCQESLGSTNPFVLLVLNQPIEDYNLLKLVWKQALFRIAADGAGNRLVHVNDQRTGDLYETRSYHLNVICGDLDSLESETRHYFESRGTDIIQIIDQDSTDFQKCTDFLRARVLPGLPDSTNIVCLGGLGGRVDQGLSQLHQLYKEQRKHGYANGRIYLLTTEALTFVLLSGTHRIRVRDKFVPAVLGRHIGIIPLKEPSVITTRGLEWDVTDWKTEFGGRMSTSNLVREDVVEVTTSKDVLFTIDLDAGSIEKMV